MVSSDVTLQAQEIRNSQKLSDKDRQTLLNIQIKLPGPVLPQHQIETRAGTRAPKLAEIERIVQYAPIKRGSFHPTEDLVIHNNWVSFCKVHDWDECNVTPFLLLREDHKSLIRSKKQRRMFVQFLANGLPNRTLYSVYHRFRNLFADRVQRRFLPEEDKMILDHLERNANLDSKRKYSDLAQVLKRTRASIWRRYQLLKKKRQYGQ